VTGLFLFVALLLAGALLGSPLVWWLRGWHDRTDAAIKRQIDELARRDWQSDILRESAAQHAPSMWEATR